MTALAAAMVGFCAGALVSMFACRRFSSFAGPARADDAGRGQPAGGEVERTYRYLDAVIDAMPQPVSVKDRDRRYVTVNAAFCQVMGVDKQGLLGRRDLDFMLPEMVAEASAEDERAFASPAPLLFQGPGRAAATARRWYLRTKAAIRLDGAEYLACVTTDITALKDAQSAAERSRAFLDALINAIPHAVFVKDREHKWVMVNDAACRLLRRSREWMIGRSDADQYDADYTRTAWAEDDTVFATGAPLTSEAHFELPDGEEIRVLKTKSRIDLPDGQYVVAISTDITERHRAQVQAERNRQFLNLVLEAMPQGVFVKDGNGRWLMVNRVTARMLGVPREQLEGRMPHEALPAAMADAVVAQDRAVLAHGGPLTFEQVPMEVEGRTIWIMKTASVARMADGTRYLVGVNTDVSELKAATLQLQHARQFLDALMDAIPMPVLVKDAAHRRVFVNEAACRFIGRPRDELLGRSDADIYPGALAASYTAQDEEALAADGVLRYEESFTRADGDQRWVVKSKRGVRLADGSRYLIMVSLDITERKAAESALEQSRGRLQLVNAVLADFTSGKPIETVLANTLQALRRAFPDMRVCYSTIDGEGRLRVIDAQQPEHMPQLRGQEFDLSGLTGYLNRLRRFELCGAGAPASAEPALPWLGAGAAASLDLPLPRGDGLLGLLSLDAAQPHAWNAHEIDTLRQVGEALQAALHAAQTDAQRRLAEREMRSARELLDAVVQAVPVVVSVKGEDGRFLFMNQTAQEMLGAPAERFLGRTDLEMYPHEQARRIQGQDAQARAASEVLTFEEILTPVSGPALWVVKRKRGVDLPDGSRGVVTTVYDVTEIKRSEMELRRHRDHLQELVDARTRELREAVEVAERASRAKSEFLANMSHELRTPMHAILSFAQLGTERAAAGGTDPGRLEQYFGRIRQSGARLLVLLNDLLDLAKLESGHMHYEFAEHDLAALATAAMQELQPLAAAAQLELRFDPCGEVPPIRCDPLRLSQVLRNLLGNAIKFTPAGGRVWLELRMGEAQAHGLPAGRALLLRVLDTGVGVPESERESIFEKFTQSTRTRNKAGGTGLGLPICREIVQAHGGVIWAESRARAGACFTVALALPEHTLPACEPEAADQPGGSVASTQN